MKSKVLMLLAGILLAVPACTSGNGGGDAQLQVSIAEPADGATITVPFTVRVDSSVELGTTESGKHHVHVYFDDDDSEYQVVESDRVEITELAPGTHVINVSLRNANHSDTGVASKITVTVADSGAPTSPSTPPSTNPSTSGGDDGYGY